MRNVTRARRARGMLLRLALKRSTAILIGVALCAPAAWLLIGDYGWESGVTDGMTMVALATGVALLWTGVSGRRPDWREP